MYTIFYTPDGREAGRMSGRRGPDEAMVPGEYIVRHVVEPEDVDREVRRRICALVGVQDDRHLNEVIVDTLRRVARLLRKQTTEGLTPEEQEEMARLQHIDDTINSIKKAGERLKNLSPIPEDFNEDKYWPVPE